MTEPTITEDEWDDVICNVSGDYDGDLRPSVARLVAVHEKRWVDWLARNNYGIDLRFTEDPPCTLTELAEAFTEIAQDGESVETWEWCIRENTGAFGGDD